MRLLPPLLAHLWVAWPLPVFPFTLALPVMPALTPGPLHSLGLLPRVLLPAPGSPPWPPAPPTPSPFPACFLQGTSHSEILSLRPAQGLGCPGALYVDESARELQSSSCRRTATEPALLASLPAPFPAPLFDPLLVFPAACLGLLFRRLRAVPGGPSQWALPRNPPPPPRPGCWPLVFAIVPSLGPCRPPGVHSGWGH